MSDTLRDRIAAAITGVRIQRDGDAHQMADAVIAELATNTIYRYQCQLCGDFYFDQSERMQRFALVHSRSHRKADDE